MTKKITSKQKKEQLNQLFAAYNRRLGMLYSDFIKKLACEISVFGLVLVVFLGLFIYRQATYATYTTLSSTKFEQKIENKDSFILVAGDSSDNTMKSFQEVMTTYQTKNRKNKLYYLQILYLLIN